MPLTLTASPVPLHLDAGGTYRVGASGVRFDTVLFAYKTGSIPQQIVKEFPTLDLADVHAVIGYYLNHRDDVEAYLAERERHATDLREKLIREGHAPADNGELRATLVERWNARA